MQRKLRYSWILPGELAVGERPDRLSELHSLGFSAALSLQEDHESGPEDDSPTCFQWKRVPIPDGIWGGVPTISQLHQAVEVIRKFLDGGDRTYVHCLAGVGRSPLACMAYLGRYRNVGLGEAIRRVSMSHLPTNPSGGQLSILARYLHGEPSGDEKSITW